MDTNQFSLGLLILAACIGFLGNLAAGYLWWNLTTKFKDKRWWHHLIGVLIVMIFLWFIYKSFQLFYVVA
ncbi:MAG: hypothetical protein ABIF40_00705 [archaeon]